MKRSMMRQMVWLTLIVVASIVPGIATGADDDTSLHQTAKGVEIYLGVLPAGMIGSHPKENPEGTMHGGIPESGYHVMVALIDASTGKRITNAQVNARVVATSMYTVIVYLT